MSSVLQYVDRTVDVLAYHGGKAQGTVLLEQALALDGTSGKITAGIQKLAQRFMIELLTEKGSLKYLPNRGTDFMIDARAGRLQTSQDVFASFSAAVVDLKTNLQVEEDEEEDP